MESKDSGYSQVNCWKFEDEDKMNRVMLNNGWSWSDVKVKKEEIIKDKRKLNITENQVRRKIEV